LDELRARADEARGALEGFLKLSASPQHPEDPAAIAAARAEAEVLLAEIDTQPQVGDPKRLLTRLDGFEERYPEDRRLIGRVLRARIIAYEATGELTAAEQAVPGYIASAPDQAGTTLQALFDATWAEVERYRARGADEQADAKARSALLFAEQLYHWAGETNGAANPEQLHALRLQLAEARLAAGNAADALPLLAETAAFDAQRHNDGLAHDPRILMAQAEALLRLQRFEQALPIFNRAFQESPVNARHRFAALLGDLRCRTELREDPAGIINVIRQHRFLSPDLGGAQLKQEFADLEQRNEARRKG
jgi:hypothetical protein